MTGARRRPPTAAVAGILLVLVGLASWTLYVQRSANEPHAYARGGAPPQYVHVSDGKTYRIAIRGGVPAEIAAGVDPASLACSAARPGDTPGALNLTDETKDTKATDDIASFTSAVTGRLHVQCAGLRDVYVSNADDAAFDWSGVWLVLASLALLVGTGLVLSALRTAGSGAGGDVRGVDPATEEVL